MKEKESSCQQRLFNNAHVCWVEEFKEPTQKTSVKEWINIYEGAKTNSINILYTTNDFKPKIKDLMHKRVVIP